MAFGKFSTLGLLLMGAALNGCSPIDNLNAKDENKVGTPLSQINTLYQQDGRPKSTIVVYDEYVHKIHQFDVNQMKMIYSQDVADQDLPHYAVSGDAGNFVIDLSAKGLRLFDKTGAKIYSSDFVGKPVSAAFRSDLGLLAIYDDLNNLTVLQLDSEGQVKNHAKLGTRLPGDATITAGDIVGNGLLALALSDDTIEVFDLLQMLNTQTWPNPTYSFSSGMTGINWVAPVRANGNLILVSSPGQVALINISLNTQNFVATLSTADLKVEKYSKSFDAHLVFSDTRFNKVLVYPDANGTKLARVTKYKEDGFSYILSSDLNIADDIWTYSSAENVLYIPLYNDVDAGKSYSRNLVRYQVSSMAAITSKVLPSSAQITVSRDFIFALFPSELGYAVRYDVTDDGQQEAKLFNMTQY